MKLYLKKHKQTHPALLHVGRHLKCSTHKTSLPLLLSHKSGLTWLSSTIRSDFHQPPIPDLLQVTLPFPIVQFSSCTIIRDFFFQESNLAVFLLFLASFCSHTQKKSMFRVGDASPYKHPPKAQLPQSTLMVTFYRCWNSDVPLLWQAQCYLLVLLRVEWECLPYPDVALTHLLYLEQDPQIQ